MALGSLFEGGCWPSRSGGRNGVEEEVHVGKAMLLARHVLFIFQGRWAVPSTYFGSAIM